MRWWKFESESPGALVMVTSEREGLEGNGEPGAVGLIALRIQLSISPRVTVYRAGKWHFREGRLGDGEQRGRYVIQ